jgi:hypothetical protein
MTNTQPVVELLEQLRQQQQQTESQIQAAEALLALLDGNTPTGSQEDQETTTYASNGQPVSFSGMTKAQMPPAYAKAQGGILRCVEFAHELVRQGVYEQSQAANAGMYHYIKQNPAFIRIAPGVFRLGGGLERREPAPTHSSATPGGRDYSLIAIPPELKRFNINSIRGQSYLDAAIATIRFLGGTATTKQISAAFWHADFAQHAPKPGVLINHIGSSFRTPKALRLLSRPQRGIYQLNQ